MHIDLRQLLEDIRHHAAAVDHRFFTRHPLVIEAAKERDASLVSTLDQSYLDCIAGVENRDISPNRFEHAALTAARARLDYWNGATMIERTALSSSSN